MRYLYRSQKHRVFGGVAGGIAEYFDIDPVIIRAAFVVSTFAWGVSFLVYIIMWIIVPEEERSRAMHPNNNVNNSTNINNNTINIENDKNKSSFEESDEIIDSRRHSGRIFVGVMLITLGTMLFLDRMFAWFNFHYYWPLLLIALGILILFRLPQHTFRSRRGL